MQRIFRTTAMVLAITTAASFKNSFAQHRTMAAPAGALAADKALDAARQATQLLKKFIASTDQAERDRAKQGFVVLMTVKTARDQFAEARKSEPAVDALYTAYGKTKSAHSYDNFFSAISEIQDFLLRPDWPRRRELIDRYGGDKNAGEFVATVIDATTQLRGLPAFERVNWAKPEDVLDQFAAGKGLRLIVEMLDARRRPIKFGEKGPRVEFLQRVYNYLGDHDSELRESLEHFRKIPAKGQFNPDTQGAIIGLANYLSIYAADSRHSEYADALNEASVAWPFRIGDKPMDGRTVDENFLRALTVYWMVQNDRWKEPEKGVFLGQTSPVSPELAPAPARRSKLPVDLQTVQWDLARGSAEEQFYKRNLQGWLQTKVTGKDAAYELYDLKQLVAFASKAAREEGAVVSAGWLDDQLENGKLKEFMDKKLPFNAADLATDLYYGRNVYESLQLLVVGQKPIDDGLDTRDRIDAERVRTVESLLRQLSTSRIADFDPIQEKLVRVTTPDGRYSKDIEGQAVQAVQDRLYELANQPALRQVLEDIGMRREDIERNGKFTPNTARALAAFISYWAGTWRVEKKAFQEIRPDIPL